MIDEVELTYIRHVPSTEEPVRVTTRAFAATCDRCGRRFAPALNEQGAAATALGCRHGDGGGRRRR